jgi:hypothetical protein
MLAGKNSQAYDEGSIPFTRSNLSKGLAPGKSHKTSFYLPLGTGCRGRCRASAGCIGIVESKMSYVLLITGAKPRIVAASRHDAVSRA